MVRFEQDEHMVPEENLNYANGNFAVTQQFNGPGKENCRNKIT